MKQDHAEMTGQISTGQISTGQISDRRGRLRRRLLCASALAGALSLVAGAGLANPSGGTVVDGTATIDTPDADTVVIDQTSDRVVIDWESFDIGAGETTRFIQPGKNSVALNRVTMGGASAILGNLEANGIVFLINPAGIVFGPGSSVDVHGLVATTSDIANQSFMDGDYSFTIPSDVPDAEVVNEGTITVGEAGIAALVSQTVRNSGVIAARLAKVALAGTETFVIDLNGDGLLSFAAPPGMDEELPSVVNNGSIQAEGGYVLMTAETAASLVDTVISMDGVIEAHSVGMVNGEVVLYAEGGEVDVTGDITVTGDDAGERGGSVSITGETVDFNGMVDVSGEAGGGAMTFVASDTIDLDGTLTGAGATLRVESEEIAITASGSGVDDDVLESTLDQNMDVTLVASTDVVVARSFEATAGSLTVEAGDDVRFNANIEARFEDSAFTATAGTDGTGTFTMPISSRIVATDSPVAVTAADDITLGRFFITASAPDLSSLSIDSDGTIRAASPGATILTLDGPVPLSLTGVDIGLTSALRIAQSGDMAGLAATTRDGEMGGIDLVLTSGGFDRIDLTLAQSEHGVDISFVSDDTVEITPGETLSTVRFVDLSDAGAGFSLTLLESGADLQVATGTLIAMGDTQLSSAGDLLIGDGDGTAIQLLGANAVLSLIAGADIVSDGGLLDLGPTGQLVFDAGGSAGSALSALRLQGGAIVAGQAGTDIFLSQADGGVLTIGMVDSVTGLTATTGRVSVIADDLAVTQAITAGTDVTITTLMDGTDIAVNDATPGLTLTPAELLLIDAPQLTLDAQSGTIALAGLGNVDLSTAPFDLTLTAASIAFAEAGTVSLRENGLVRLLGGTVTGGGATADLSTVNGQILLDLTGTASLRTALAAIAGSAGSLDLINDGALTIGTVEGVSGLTTDLGADLEVAGTLDLITVLTTGGATALTATGDVTFGALGGLNASSHNARVDIASTGGALDLMNGMFALAGNDVALNAAGNIVAVLQGTPDETVSLSAFSDTGLVDITYETGGGLRIADLGGGANGISAATIVSVQTDRLAVDAPIAAGGTVLVTSVSDDVDVRLGDNGPGLALDNAELNEIATTASVTFRPGSDAALRLADDTLIDITSRGWSDLILDAPAIFAGASIDTAGTILQFLAPVTLTRSVAFNTDNGSGGATILLPNAIGTDGLGAWDLSLDAGMADILADADIGAPDDRLGMVSLTGGTIRTQSIFATTGIGFAAKDSVVLGAMTGMPPVTLDTQNGAIAIAGPLTLAADALFTSAGPGDLGADITLEGVTLDGFTFTLDAGTDGAIETDALSGGTTPVNGMVDVQRAASLTVNGPVEADTLALRAIGATGVVNGTVTLNTLIIDASSAALSFLGGGTLSAFVEALNTGGLTLAGLFDFENGIDATAGETTLNADITAGGQGIVLADVGLSGDTSLTSLDGSAITLGAVTGNGHDLTIDSGMNGQVALTSFFGDVGGAPAGSFTLAEAASATIAGALKAANIILTPGQGQVTVGGLLDAETLTIGNGDFAIGLLGGALVTDAVTFANLGGVVLGDDSADVFTVLGGFTALNAETRLSGRFQTEDAPILLGRTLLGDDVVISTQGAGTGADISVTGLIDGTGAGGQDLSLTAGPAGTVLLEQDAGSVTPLGSLLFSGGAVTVEDIVSSGDLTFRARDVNGDPGLVTVNSNFTTDGGDLTIDANIVVDGDFTIDTMNGTSGGGIFIGSDGTVIEASVADVVVELLAGDRVVVRGLFDEGANAVSELIIRAASSVELAGGRFSGLVSVTAGSLNGDPRAIADRSILITGPLAVDGLAVLQATGNIEINAPFTALDARLSALDDVIIRDRFSVDRLLMLLNGTARTERRGFLSIENEFVIGGIGPRQGASNLRGEVRGFRSGEAAAFARQLGPRRRDAFLFNDCVIGVGCFQLDRSAIVIRSFDIIVAPYTPDPEVSNIRFSDLGNFELFRRLGLTNEWQADEGDDQ